MARKKRTSPAITHASNRATGLASIDPALDLGDGRTLVNYQATIASVQKSLDEYNTLLGSLDGKLTDLENAENALDSQTSQFLTAVALKYGKDSKQYEQAGGTRTSEYASSGSTSAETPKPVPAATA